MYLIGTINKKQYEIVDFSKGEYTTKSSKKTKKQKSILNKMITQLEKIKRKTEKMSLKDINQLSSISETINILNQNIMEHIECKTVNFTVVPYLLFIPFGIPSADTSFVFKHQFVCTYNYENIIKELLEDSTFQQTVYNILFSKIMEDYYSKEIIHIEEQGTNAEKKIAEKMYDAYLTLKKQLNKTDELKNFFNSIFYVTKLPSNLKGLTHRYLRILINCYGISIIKDEKEGKCKNNEIDENENNEEDESIEEDESSEENSRNEENYISSQVKKVLFMIIFRIFNVH